MTKANEKTNMVKVNVLKPFHVGIDKRVNYKPGVTELDEKIAEKAIAAKLAEKID